MTKERKEVVPIRFPPSWIAWIQDWCEEHGLTKSEYIQEAVKEKMLEDGYLPEGRIVVFDEKIRAYPQNEDAIAMRDAGTIAIKKKVVK